MSLIRKTFDYLVREIRYVKNSIKAMYAEGRTDLLAKNAEKDLRDEVKGRKLVTTSETYKLEYVDDEPFSKYLHKFMYSYRNKNDPSINLNNLLILSGPDGYGKSWFLRHNLKKFKVNEADKRTLVIHYDLDTVPSQSFASFLANFEENIIASISERNKLEIQLNKRFLLTIDGVLEVLYYRWEKGWLEYNFYKILSRAISEQDTSYSIEIAPDFYDEINNILDLFLHKGMKEYPIQDEFRKIVEILEKSSGEDELTCALKLIREALILREDMKKNENVFKGEVYRDGIETIEFLFDVLNFVAGYHELQTKNKKLNLNTELFPHVVLALESVQNFFEMRDAERRPLDYLHTIILRLYNNEGYRDHFPVIFETNKTYYFDFTLYNEIFDNKWRFPTLVYTPKEFYHNMSHYLNPLINNEQIQILEETLKDSGIYYYAFCIEALKLDPENLSAVVNFSSSETTQREFVRYFYKLNKTYLHPALANFLDDGSIDIEIFDFLTQWNKLYKKNLIPKLSIRKEMYDYEFLNRPITQAFFDSGLTFFHKYHSEVQQAHYIYFDFIYSILQYFKTKKMSKLTLLYYTIYWCRFSAFVFYPNFYGIGYRRTKINILSALDEDARYKFIHGLSAKWDVPMELYKGNFKGEVSDDHFYATVSQKF